MLMVLRTLFIHKRNQVISDLHNAEMQYFSKEIDINISDTNRTWKILRQIIGYKASNI